MTSRGQKAWAWQGLNLRPLRCQHSAYRRSARKSAVFRVPQQRNARRTWRESGGWLPQLYRISPPPRHLGRNREDIRMTMREKIARALFDEAWSNCGRPHASFESYDSDGLQHNPYRNAADAVLAAMREPTEAMIVAGIIERHDSDTPEAWKLATTNIFTAMIDAARC